MRSFFLFLAPSASRAVFLSAVAFFLSGCQTNAQKQHSELRSSVDSASINVTACNKEVQSRPQFSTIVHRLSLTTESPSVDHFVDSSRPTHSMGMSRSLLKLADRAPLVSDVRLRRSAVQELV